MMAENNQAALAVCAQTKVVFPYIYILSVFTEKPYSKAMERYEVYVSIIILSHATSHDGK